MRKCKIEGCTRERNYRNFCNLHYHRLLRNGDPLKIVNSPYGGGHQNDRGYIRIRVNGVRKYEHIHLAEKALGKVLPPGAQVHHVNNVHWDNVPGNLVICPNDEYHKLLHRRSKELGYLK